MYVSSKNWTAQNDRMPGCAAFKVKGNIELAEAGVTATLVKSALQDKSHALRLELKLEHAPGAALQVVSEQSVSFEMPGQQGHIPKVDIYYENEHLATITEILVTD